MQDGIEALTVRLLLAERAERTIDTQHYLTKSDTARLAFFDALLKAADRGVRVRLLIDDVFTNEWAPYQLVYDSPDKGIKSKTGPPLRSHQSWSRR